MYQNSSYFYSSSLPAHTIYRSEQHFAPPYMPSALPRPINKNHHHQSNMPQNGGGYQNGSLEDSKWLPDLPEEDDLESNPYCNQYASTYSNTTTSAIPIPAKQNKSQQYDEYANASGSNNSNSINDSMRSRKKVSFATPLTITQDKHHVPSSAPVTLLAYLPRKSALAQHTKYRPKPEYGGGSYSDDNAHFSNNSRPTIHHHNSDASSFAAHYHARRHNNNSYSQMYGTIGYNRLPFADSYYAYPHPQQLDNHYSTFSMPTGTAPGAPHPVKKELYHKHIRRNSIHGSHHAAAFSREKYDPYVPTTGSSSYDKRFATAMEHLPLPGQQQVYM